MAEKENMENQSENLKKVENSQEETQEETQEEITFHDEDVIKKMSDEDISEYRSKLEGKANEIQKENQSKNFTVKLNESHDIKRIMNHLDKGYTWKTNNAALIVKLYDSLKEQYKYYKDYNDEDFESITIELPGYELNALYQALINVEGTGIEKARNFLRLLTNTGQSVSDAMAVLGDLNKDIKTIHNHLQYVDQEIEERAQDSNETTDDTPSDNTQSEQ